MMGCIKRITCVERIIMIALEDRPVATTTTTTRRIPDAATEPTISVKRAASVLGISVRHAYAAAERGEIPSIRVGRSIVVPTARFLETYPDLVAARNGDQAPAVA